MATDKAPTITDREVKILREMYRNSVLSTEQIRATKNRTQISTRRR